MCKSKRLITLLLTASLLLSAFSSCAKPQEDESDAEQQNTPEAAVPGESAEEETADPMLQDDLPDTTFNGYNFRVLSCEFVGRELAKFLMSDEMNGDAVNDELFNITTEVEDRFDVDISYFSVANTGVVSETVRTSVNGGTDDFDIQCGIDTTTATLGKQGFFINLYDVDQLNFDKPWYPKNIMSQLDMAGKLFIGSTYLTFNGLHWTRVLIANKDRFDEMQLEMPYEPIMNGTWYFDDMRVLAESGSRDLDGDGVMGEKDLYGFCLGGGVTYCLQDTFGMVFHRETEDGLLVDVDQERIDTILEGLRVLIDNEDATYLGAEFSQTQFLNNQTLLATTMIGTAYDDFRGTEIHFSILPFPKYDELQPEYINTCTDAFWAIPTTAYNNLDVIGTVIEALSCQNYQRVLPIYYETAIKTRLSDSPNDAAMFDIIKDSRTIGFEYAYGMTFKDIVNTLIIQKSAAFSTYFARQQKSAQKAADKFYEEFKNIHAE